MARRVIPSERLELDNRVSEPHDSAALRQFLELKIEAVDRHLQRTGFNYWDSFTASVWLLLAGGFFFIVAVFFVLVGVWL